jgi:hypothetical protein
VDIVDLTSEEGASSGQEQSTSNTRRQNEPGAASRAPRFPNDIINPGLPFGMSHTPGFRSAGSSLHDVPTPQPTVRSTSNTGTSTNALENDGFEIVGQRQVPLSQHLAQSLHQHSVRLGGSNFAGTYAALQPIHHMNPESGGPMGNFLRSMAQRLGPLTGMSSFMIPTMDYTTVSFSLGYPNNSSDPVTESTPATRYESPNPAPPGFTFTPNEKDTYVCPNCDNELLTGESDLERQVWVVKACGHVSLLHTSPS